MNDHELWLLKNALLSVDGGMGIHPCIAQVGFESSHAVFLNCYNVLWNEYSYNDAIENVDMKAKCEDEA